MNQLETNSRGLGFFSRGEAALAQALRLAKWNQSHLTVLHVIDEEVIEELALALNQPRAKVEATARQTAQAEMEAGWRAKALTRAPGWSSARRSMSCSPRSSPCPRICWWRAPATISQGQHGKSCRHVDAQSRLQSTAWFSPVRPDRIGELWPAWISRLPPRRRSRLRVAANDGSRVHCLHVYEPPWHDLQHRMPSLVVEPDFQAVSNRHAGLAARIRRRGCADPVQAALSGAEHHLHGIAEFAQQTNADLIVLGTHGRSHVRYMLLGSTAEGLFARS